jgi:hypothetical protein
MNRVAPARVMLLSELNIRLRRRHSAGSGAGELAILSHPATSREVLSRVEVFVHLMSLLRLAFGRCLPSIYLISSRKLLGRLKGRVIKLHVGLFAGVLPFLSRIVLFLS